MAAQKSPGEVARAGGWKGHNTQASKQAPLKRALIQINASWPAAPLRISMSIYQLVIAIGVVLVLAAVSFVLVALIESFRLLIGV
jgi:hypothetical protein